MQRKGPPPEPPSAQPDAAEREGSTLPPAIGFYFPPELAPEALLSAMRFSPDPLEDTLRLIARSLRASYFAVVYRGEAGERARGETNRGARIPRLERLVKRAGVDRALAGATSSARGAADLDPRSSAWRLTIGVFTQSDPSPTTRRALGAFVLGGRRDALPSPYRRKPAGLDRALQQVAPWVGAAMLLDLTRAADGRAPGELEARTAPVDTARSEAGDAAQRRRRFERLLFPSSGVEHHPEFPALITSNAKMRALLDAVLRVAPSDASVLIEGESGTGKELIARAIHEKSERRKQPFVSENCAACPASLLESEFFGVEKGAFTGATESKPGLFERACGGTIFFDEVGEMDLPLQSKLLRVLQERVVRRVGGRESIPVDFRLVSATNRSLEAEVRRTSFRLDLLYRLEVVKLVLPPLRERPEDVPHLARHFLRTHAESLGRTIPAITNGAMEIIANYAWPGNIRELQNEMWRAVALGHREITPARLSKKLAGRPSSTSRQAMPRGFSFTALERDVLGAVLRAALQSSGGNASKAARLLGIPRSTLYRRLGKYGIPLDADEARVESPIELNLAKYRFVDEILREEE